MNIRALTISGLIAGIIMALALNLPYLSYINYLCCVGIWGGGIFGAWLYQRLAGHVTISSGQGAVVGGFSGIVCAIISMLFGFILVAFAALTTKDMWVGFIPLTSVGDKISYASNFSKYYFLLLVVVAPIFGAIGGAIGGIIFGKKTSNNP